MPCYHCDKHISKMVVESVQLLCTAHRVDKTAKPWMYKATHRNHPCALWVRESKANYMWLLKLAEELSAEYSRRYNRVHKTHRKIVLLRKLAGSHGNWKPTKFIYCGDARACLKTVVGSYRKLYSVKSRTMKVLWMFSKKPTWFVQGRRVKKQIPKHTKKQHSNRGTK